MTCLTDILTLQRIKMPVEASSKEEMIGELVDVLADNGDISDRQAVMDAVLDREATRTTAIGGGLAIPHGKCSAVGKLMMVIGKVSQPAEVKGIDGQPVTLVILLVYPDSQSGPHMEALARLSRLLEMEEFRSALEEASSCEDLFNAFCTLEQQKLAV